MEKDFFQLLSAVKKMGESEEVELINLREIIEEALNHFSHLLENKKVFKSLQDVYVPMRRSDAENLFFFIIDNAVRYSLSKIQIRLRKTKGKAYFVVCNDVKKSSTKGSGVGLELVKFVCQRYGIRFKIRRGRTFCICINLSFL